MDQALATARSPLVGKRTFNDEYPPLRWRTVMLWGEAGRIKVIRIRRKHFLVRADVEQIIAEGGCQFVNRRERASSPEPSTPQCSLTSLLLRRKKCSSLSFSSRTSRRGSPPGVVVGGATGPVLMFDGRMNESWEINETHGEMGAGETQSSR
jgi:hypothetical protein